VDTKVNQTRSLARAAAILFAALITIGLTNSVVRAWSTTTGSATAAVARIGGSVGETGRGIAVDSARNIYATGWFAGTTDMDPGSGVVDFTSAGGTDVYATKLDGAGDLVWAKQFGGVDQDEAIRPLVDSNGHVYVVGNFYGTADFDPGAGVSNLVSNGVADVFVVKLNSSGDLLWARGVGGLGLDSANEAALDASGNIYVTGSFVQTVDFDPGAGVSNLTSAGNNDVFITKFNSAGDLVWAKAFGGASGDRAYGLDVDATGNVYTAGYIAGTADLDPDPTATVNFTSLGSNDIFLSKLTSTGTFVWAKTFGGIGQDGGRGVSVDTSGNVFVTGFFWGTVDFDPDPAASDNVTAAGGEDAFVSKFAADGTYMWLKTIGGADADRTQSIAVDSVGNLYLCGVFKLTVDFDPDPTATANLTSGGDNDGFVWKLGASGRFDWVKQIKGSGIDWAFQLALDPSANVYTTGTFEAVSDFDPAGAGASLTSFGLSDAFILGFTTTGAYPTTTTTTTTTTTIPPTTAPSTTTIAPTNSATTTSPATTTSTSIAKKQSHSSRTVLSTIPATGSDVSAWPVWLILLGVVVMFARRFIHPRR
jgi:hypothetical protein